MREIKARLRVQECRGQHSASTSGVSRDWRRANARRGDACETLLRPSSPAGAIDEDLMRQENPPARDRTPRPGTVVFSANEMVVIVRRKGNPLAIRE
jgi:hypothetical protein